MANGDATRRRLLMSAGAAGAAAFFAGCSTDGDDDSTPELRGELDVTLRNGLDEEVEARFLLVSPDGVPRIDEAPAIDGDDEWRARATGLVPGRYSYTVGAPTFSVTEFWTLDEDCPRLVIDAVVAASDVVDTDTTCESLDA